MSHHADRLRRLAPITNGITARTALNALEEALDGPTEYDTVEDDVGDGAAEYSRAWFTAGLAADAARSFASDEEDGEDEADEADAEDEEDEEDPAVLARDIADAAAAREEEAPRLVAAAERAAKYAATRCRRAAANAAEARAEHAEGLENDESAMTFRKLMNIGFRASRAEYLWQAARLSELVGIEWDPAE
ncbi:MAG: hypothetical protein V4515_07905 [Chloroflexota bacterium]